MRKPETDAAGPSEGGTFTMSIVMFLRGYLVTLAVFAAAAWALSGSLATTLVATAVAAILIQAGYFLAILLLVARTPKRQTAAQNRRRGQSEAEKAEGDAARGLVKIRRPTPRR